MADADTDADEEAPTFFVDTCLGTKDVPGALRAAGAKVICLVEEFAPDARDDVWLPEVGRRGLVVLTKDKWIRRRTNELEALRTAGVGAFILSARDMNGQQMGVAFVAALPAMLKFLARFARGGGHYFVARVSATGAVELVDGGTRRSGIKRESSKSERRRKRDAGDSNSPSSSKT